MKLSRDDRERAIRKLKNFTVQEKLKTLADTYMHFEPSNENEQELYDAMGWAIVMLKVQHATISAYAHSCSDNLNQEVREITAELLAACGIADSDIPEKKRQELSKKYRRAPNTTPFRVIKGGR